jgi:hypothetical protein
VPNGKFFVCTTAGTTGGSEPSWATSSVTDNTVTWQELSAGVNIFTGEPLSNCGYVGNLNAVGLASFEWMTKEYVEGDIFSEKLLDALQIAAQSSMPQTLNVEFQEEMGNPIEGSSIDLTKLGATLPFTLGTQIVSETAAFRAVKSADGARIQANSFRFRGYPSTNFLVDASNQTVIFTVGGAAVTVTVPTGYYATIDALMSAVATAAQAAWRAAGLGGSGTVSYTSGSNSGFPVFSRYQPCKFVWAAFTAASKVVTLTTPGCLTYAGFEDPTRCGTFTDNGNLYAHALVAPINPTTWKFIAAKMNGRIWRRQSLSKQG